MKPEEKKYIDEHAGKESAGTMARKLGLKERKVRKYLEKRSAPAEADTPQRPPKSPVSLPRANKALLVLLLIGVIFAAYSNIITGEFVWDDQTIVVINDAIRSFEHVGYIFRNEFCEKVAYNGNIYRPVQEFSFMVDYFLWGLDSKGFHFTNVVLQVTCAILLFYLITALSGSEIVACIAALIFGVHPVNTEAISYISGRSDPIFFIFIIASMLLYVRARSAHPVMKGVLYPVSLLFYGISLATRETATVFPLILVAYELWMVKAKPADLYRVVPYFAVLAFYVFFRVNFIELNTSMLQPAPIGAILLTDFKLIFKYLVLILFPFGLHMTRRVMLSTALDSTVVISSIVVIPLLALVFRARKKRSDIFFWTLWFLILLLPHLNFIGLNAAFAEHWIYAGAVGLYVIGALFLVDLMKKGAGARTAAYLCIAGLVLYFGSLTFVRNFDWRKEPDIYLSTLTYSKTPKVLSNLGVYYERHNQLDEAIEVYEEALTITPNATLFQNNIAVAYYKKGNIKKALEHWKISLGIDPNQPKIEKMVNSYR